MPKTFNEQYYELLKQIPMSKVVTYGDITLAKHESLSAVRNAMGANPTAIIVPCHDLYSAKEKSKIKSTTNNNKVTKQAIK